MGKQGGGGGRGGGAGLLLYSQTTALWGTFDKEDDPARRGRVVPACCSETLYFHLGKKKLNEQVNGCFTPQRSNTLMEAYLLLSSGTSFLSFPFFFFFFFLLKIM